MTATLWDFVLDQDQKLILETVHSIVEKEVSPRAAELDKKETFPWDAVKAMAKEGLMGLMIPQAYGGAGERVVTLCAVIEEIAGACASTAVVYATQSHCAYPIILAGSEAQKKTYLTRLASGEAMGAIAITEPQAGSDVSAIATTAEKKGGHYVLTGTKVFCTSGDVADILVVFATVDKGKGKKGITAFIVEKGFPGVRVGKIERKMGLRASSTAEIILEDCEIPQENRLGGEGEGFALALAFFDKSRPGIGAQAVGIAQAAFDAALAYSRERKQFGVPIFEFQAVQFMLADMAVQISAARHMVYHAARTLDTGGEDRPTLESSMAKLFASDTAMRVTTDAVQILGGYGYIKDYPVERYFRDAKATQIYEGTNQIQRMIIARRL